VFFAGADPVAAGLVDSQAKPGGRLTGIHGLSRDLTAKRLEILKEMIPGLGRVRLLPHSGRNGDEPGAAGRRRRQSQEVADDVP
jgi:ABC-type uncharacterized transport system substrate-binding protein